MICSDTAVESSRPDFKRKVGETRVDQRWESRSTLDMENGEVGADWYCDHDVPDGCRDCRFLKAEAEALDAMTDQERRDYLYDTGTFETYFAAGGPAWQKEEMERMGLRGGRYNGR